MYLSFAKIQFLKHNTSATWLMDCQICQALSLHLDQNPWFSLPPGLITRKQGNVLNERIAALINQLFKVLNLFSKVTTFFTRTDHLGDCVAPGPHLPLTTTPHSHTTLLLLTRDPECFSQLSMHLAPPLNVTKMSVRPSLTTLCTEQPPGSSLTQVLTILQHGPEGVPGFLFYLSVLQVPHCEGDEWLQCNYFENYTRVCICG